jgi:hypothetical protein
LAELGGFVAGAGGVSDGIKLMSLPVGTNRTSLSLPGGTWRTSGALKMST